MKSSPMTPRKYAEETPESDALRDWIVQQPPQAPPEEVRVQLLQRVKTLRPALFSPPLALRVWGAFLALWVFMLLAWLAPPGPMLSWESEHPQVADFLIYRGMGETWQLILDVPSTMDWGSYEVVDAYYLPLHTTVSYLIVARDMDGHELDRVSTALPAWPVWFQLFAFLAFSLSFAAFMVTWLHWRDLHHLPRKVGVSRPRN